MKPTARSSPKQRSGPHGRDATQKRAMAIERTEAGTTFREGKFTEISNQKTCIEPDVIFSALYAHTRRMKAAETQEDPIDSKRDESSRVDFVVGSLLGYQSNGIVHVHDSFINAVESTSLTSITVVMVIRRYHLQINGDHHTGVLNFKAKAQSTSAGQQKDEVVGMIIDKVDFDVMIKLHNWLIQHRATSKFIPTNKLPVPIFVCIDTSLSSGRLEIKAYQRDRNQIMFLELPVTIGHSFPKSVLTAIKQDMDATEVSGSSLRDSLETFVETLNVVKSAVVRKNALFAREAYNALCINPLMKDIASEKTLERMTGDSMGLVHLLRLAELQAEIAKKLNTSFE